MSRILVIFASQDGQTARIARRIGEVLSAAAQTVIVRAVDAPDAASELLAADAVIVGGAVRFGHHLRSLEKFVRESQPALAARPNAFFSVSLSASHADERHRAESERMVAEFAKATGWHPDATMRVAGALRYSRYNPFIRFMLKMISTVSGGDTDTSKDYEYTDWKAVDAFAAGFVQLSERARASA